MIPGTGAGGRYTNGWKSAECGEEWLGSGRISTEGSG